MLAVSWSLEYHVPWSLFAKYHKTPAPTKGTVYRANLYKCADQTSHPHWVRTPPTLHLRLEPSKAHPQQPPQSPPAHPALPELITARRWCGQGAWAPVGTPRPDFHRPSDFQTLLFHADSTPLYGSRSTRRCDDTDKPRL